MSRHTPESPESQGDTSFIMKKDVEKGSTKATGLAREAERSNRIRIKNRRRMYLDKNPIYFDAPELELADPLLYDRCIRRFQTPAEREEEGRNKGYSGVLEADLYRSEAKLAALETEGSFFNGMTSSIHRTTYVRGPEGQILPEDPDEIPADKEEGMNIWKYEMTARFINGEDKDFSYGEVDENDMWDTVEDRDAEDQWFEDEEPQWLGHEDDVNGETGIQDF